ncbi:MAG: T9SS type A sorting domain-containing protein [Bacteroidales bacterium]
MNRVKSKLILSAIISVLCSSMLLSQSTFYEAEHASLYHAVTETKNSGYLGESYVNFDNEVGSYIEFPINMGEEGWQLIHFRYANGGTMARTMGIHLNGNPTDSVLVFALTGSWTNWIQDSVHLNLQKGLNFLRLSSLVSEGGPNLDQIEVNGKPGAYYGIALTFTGPGSVSITPALDSFYEGQSVHLTANANLDGSFSGWSGDLSGSDPEADVIMNSNKSIGATFQKKNTERVGPDFNMTGFAAVQGDGLLTTTGGYGGEVTIVSNLDDLVAYAKVRENNSSPGILYIKGNIEAPSSTVVTFKHGANITILGSYPFGELNNIGLNIWDYNNVIIRNMKIHEVIYPNDAITINACKHVWIDHNELYSKIGPGIGVDTYDGLLDIKEGSKYVTLSWNYLHHHMKCSLIGHSDSNGDVDTAMRITIHHNYYSNTDGRNPSLRFGAIHFYNNYQENISDYGIAVRQGAHAKIENNHFESVNIPVTTNKFSGPEGFICASGNAYTGSCSESDNSITQTDCDFWNILPYAYVPDPVESVSAQVTIFTGAGLINTIPGLQLSSLSTSAGELYPSFSPEVLKYSLELPAGTTSVLVTAGASNQSQVIEGDGVCTEFPRTMKIRVHDPSLTDSVFYQVMVSISGLSPNALLQSLSVGAGQLSPSFDPMITNYTLELPAGSQYVFLNAITQDTSATLTGSGNITDFSHPAIIRVVAPDGTIKEYIVQISVASTVVSPNKTYCRIYPNPTGDLLTIYSNENADVQIMHVTGKIITEWSITSGHNMFSVQDLPGGIYIVRIEGKSFTENMKLLINK